MTRAKESIRTLNGHLDALQNKVYEVYKTLLQGELEISAERIKNKLTGIAERPRLHVKRHITFSLKNMQTEQNQNNEQGLYASSSFLLHCEKIPLTHALLN
jgi:hypothetical protein